MPGLHQILKYNCEALVCILQWHNWVNTEGVSVQNSSILLSFKFDNVILNAKSLILDTG